MLGSGLNLRRHVDDQHDDSGDDHAPETSPGFDALLLRHLEMGSDVVLISAQGDIAMNQFSPCVFNHAIQTYR